MEQLLLKMDDKSDVKVIAASAYNFRIELVKKVGKDDIPGLIDISHCMAERFGTQALLTKTNIPKYFNFETLPFIARYKGEIIGYIIGVPLEYFRKEAWAHYDVNLGLNNTIYTYAFVVNAQYQSRGGYAKSLKRVYLNWVKKRNYSYITGHTELGVAKNFSKDTETVKIFPEWYNSRVSFEYYRRPIK